MCLTDGQIFGSAGPSSNFSSVSPQYGQPGGRNSSYVPFVPLSPDMFAKKPENSEAENRGKEIAGSDELVAPNTGERVSNDKSRELVEKPSNQAEMDIDKEQIEKSDRWFKKVAELHNVTDLASAISDEDFPEIMPMRKGENRFVVSKKKDRSLISPAYKRQMAMEQASDTKFVPFVPFPPDYFAKKDDKPQANGADLGTKDASELPDRLYNARPSEHNKDRFQQTDNRSGLQSWNSETSPGNLSVNQTDGAYKPPASGNVSRSFTNSVSNNDDILGSSGISGKESPNAMPNSTRSSLQPPENQNNGESWRGKSLEGSAVKEPDPLDMSEEAKAERWFRRVAQIKDISELSQIPDEDFPSIMPMRKGVNRFVVSKRKTPLERRLTSPQYRRNLPIVSSDPIKKENDNS